GTPLRVAAIDLYSDCECAGRGDYSPDGSHFWGAPWRPARIGDDSAGSGWICGGVRRRSGDVEGGTALARRIRATGAGDIRRQILAGVLVRAGGDFGVDWIDRGVWRLFIWEFRAPWKRNLALGTDPSGAVHLCGIFRGVSLPRVHAIHPGRRNWFLAGSDSAVGRVWRGAPGESRRRLGWRGGCGAGRSVLLFHAAADGESLVCGGTAREL